MRRVTSASLNTRDFVQCDSSWESRSHMVNTTMPAVAYKCHHKHLEKSPRVKVSNVGTLTLLEKRPKYGTKIPRMIPLEDTPVINTSKSRQRKSLELPSPSLEDDTQSIQQQTSLNMPTQPSDDTSQTLNLHYQGHILLYPYRLLKHLRSETHHEVYTADSLSTGCKFEVKVYTLRGIHPNQRRRRVENLKKTTALPSFVTSFDCKRKKYAVFLAEHDCKGTETRKLKLGAIGRRNTKEYEEAFPKLPEPSGPFFCTATTAQGRYRR
jgi:hypothetical protein